MNSKTLYRIGIAGVVLFVLATVLAHLQMNRFYPMSQYISESFALGTPYGSYLRYLGVLPSGILITLFTIKVPNLVEDYSPAKWGFYLFAIFYGLGTVIIAFFPCEMGCSRGRSDIGTLQMMHNAFGMLTYFVSPFALVLIGTKLKGLLLNGNLSAVSFVCGFLSLVFIYLFATGPEGNFVGLFQRLAEATFLFWIVYTAINVKTCYTSKK
ncbi:MAG: DUF998 domain-containing protein [Bacteroidia bacterium]|nr:DUF998 domain-containing protein [Bacteroidia bacterium]